MRQYWLVVGTQNNWEVAFETNNIWGLKDFRELNALWNMLREGDGLLFYVSKPIHGIVGFGFVSTKFKQSSPLWPEEIKRNEVLWPLRFEFDIEYCLPPNLWVTHRYTSPDLQLITRMVFQCYPIEEVNLARIGLDLAPIMENTSLILNEPVCSITTGTISHSEVISDLAEIGLIQGYISDKEYMLESTRLDVVWRRVERSVPTYVFEVQVGGDIYHAMAKLKHAFDLWNSHIFLVASNRERGKYEELLAGTFHEVADKMHFIEINLIKELLAKKLDYKRMEQALGIMRR
ncbi:MAG: EVE domain-containing protein [Dehalococcoidales bacterium]